MSIILTNKSPAVNPLPLTGAQTRLFYIVSNHARDLRQCWPRPYGQRDRQMGISRIAHPGAHWPPLRGGSLRPRARSRMDGTSPSAPDGAATSPQRGGRMGSADGVGGHAGREILRCGLRPPLRMTEGGEAGWVVQTTSVVTRGARDSSLRAMPSAQNDKNGAAASLPPVRAERARIPYIYPRNHTLIYIPVCAAGIPSPAGRCGARQALPGGHLSAGN